MDKLEQYLDRVCRGIGGPRALRQHVRQELREHLLDAVAQHRTAGLTEEAALTRALDDFGGPEQVRSELEATHGQRLLPVVIDKAMQWKEMTMKAKWLWTTWAYLAAVGVIAVEVLFFTFAQVACVPKLRKIQSEGWLNAHAASVPVLAWLDSCLRGLDWVATNLTWCMLIVAGMWGLFEWRVRSENKPFMRLSALGTAAFVLALGVVLVAAALVLPFLVGLPAMARLSAPIAVRHMAVIDTEVNAIEHALAKNDWTTMQEHADQASQAMTKLEEAATAIHRQTSLEEKATLDRLRARLYAAKTYLADAQRAIREKNAAQLEAAINNIHAVYGSRAKAATKPEK